MKHAQYSPSGFKALMLCPAKPALEHGLPDTRSDYTDEGTAGHFLLAHCLRENIPTSACTSWHIAVGDNGASWTQATHDTESFRVFQVDGDMARYVQQVVDYVLALASHPGAQLHIEVSVPIDHVTGEEGATGTADIVVICGTVLWSIDLKYGRGITVSPIENPQCLLYAAGALRLLDLVGDIERIVCVIHQPRIDGPKEWETTVGWLHDWCEQVARPAVVEASQFLSDMQAGVDVSDRANPHPEACQFCKAKPCRKMDEAAMAALGATVTDLTTEDQSQHPAIVQRLVPDIPLLGAKMSAVELVELWCKAIRSATEKALLAGHPVEGWKLVEGKQGNRKWRDDAEAEAALKALRLKVHEMYDKTIISPTTAEKLLGDKKRVWPKILPLITRADGKPSVAPASDKRPALVAGTVTPITDEPEDSAPVQVIVTGNPDPETQTAIGHMVEAVAEIEDLI